eukprot:CAMPEP_0180287810 /NCGR_PEP_ID=MMETSP0988-20121125/13621_1 /TAXON_ID=697907 /ORGANISM="non described non described, Strain CCMP2293" /LENGTH=842 /DNA_ID=CAMNT_0022262261 /DNA_START=659 /DNA_END=3183 /DNA_ORIENTATION=+
MEAGSSLEISLEPVHAFDQDWVSAPALATSPRGSPPASSIHTQEMQHFDAAGMGTPYPSRPPTMPDHFLAIAHPGTGGPDDMHLLPESVVLPSMFTLRGELMHAFVSYRGATEGPAGNGLAEKVAAKIRSMSTDSKQLQIPRHGWGIWPKSAKRPVPFRPEEAKVYLGKDCLQDGQSWLAGFVQGLVVSMTFVPLLSWEEGDEGSLGELSRIGVNGFDRVDNVLLEMILATAFREDSRFAVHAILPVIVGAAAEGGGFGTFPFHKLARLSDEPSRATNALAATILRQLGLGEDKVQDVVRLSVKQVVDSVLRNQGVYASASGDVESECAAKVLTTVLQEMRRLRSDPKYFERGRPMASEVLEWLQEENLRSYAPLFVYHRLDSLDYVARLEKENLSQLFDEHEELFPRSGQKGAMGGELAKLEKAHSNLMCHHPRCLGLICARPDERTLPLSDRLEGYSDTEASAMALMSSGNGLELLHSKTGFRWIWVVGFPVCGYVVAAFWRARIQVEIWGNPDFFFFAEVVLACVGGLLVPVCRTARTFVDALAWLLPAYFSTFIAAWALTWIQKGEFFFFCLWVPMLAVVIFFLRFRKHLVLWGFTGALFLGWSAAGPLMCIKDCGTEVYSSYGECVLERYVNLLPLLLSFGVLIALLIAREVTNLISTRSAARSTREHHRAVWWEEVSKLAASPEVNSQPAVLGGRGGEGAAGSANTRCPLARPGGKVMAFLNQRAGRWSLRGPSIKARQAHGDIDLLFDEAAMVNEPFLDLMASLVAGIVGTPGCGSLTRAGSEEWSGRIFSPSDFNPSERPAMALKRGPIKKPARALQKLVRLYGRDVAMLTDLV